MIDIIPLIEQNVKCEVSTPDRICPVCEKTVTGHKKRKYCSAECISKHQYQSLKAKGYWAARDRGRAECLMNNCLICEKPLTGHTMKQYCSKACENTYRRLHYKSYTLRVTPEDETL